MSQPLHNSDSEEIQFFNVDPSLHMKPRGLWYARGTIWLEWAIRNSGRAKIFAWLHTLDLGRLRIATLQTIAEQEAFARHYSRPDCHLINWRQVAQDWDGVEIVGQQLIHRTAWSQLFSAPSGCIWNAERLEVVQTLQTPEKFMQPILPTPISGTRGGCNCKRNQK